ncbi:uncharacterized protein SRS1_10079 [Sporisorium reilianum f. sp. reilianum]|uniref:Uncharacterized protein n=1 Tax=Sporisorium reilianum f. sp. reilianum TaxID=72559 RepID=A0A2N8ULF9_9BASI|nr:uncharacterized protein SRS1_10079 [Sporisorium reilianum f. sp. reilianum]
MKFPLLHHLSPVLFIILISLSLSLCADDDPDLDPDFTPTVYDDITNAAEVQKHLEPYEEHIGKKDFFGSVVGSSPEVLARVRNHVDQTESKFLVLPDPKDHTTHVAYTAYSFQPANMRTWRHAVGMILVRKWRKGQVLGEAWAPIDLSSEELRTDWEHIKRHATLGRDELIQRWGSYVLDLVF